LAIEIRSSLLFLDQRTSRPRYYLRLPFKLPLFNVDTISGLAILMGAHDAHQQKMSIKDPSQKRIGLHYAGYDEH